MFVDLLDGERPGEARIKCACGWVSESRPGHELDLDVHFAEVNGVTYEEQKRRTRDQLRDLVVPNPTPRTRS